MIELLKGTRKNLMTGVSYMIPFVVAGGYLVSIECAAVRRCLRSR